MPFQETLHDLFIFLRLERARRIDQQSSRSHQRGRGGEQPLLAFRQLREHGGMQPRARIGMAPHRSRRAARRIDQHRRQLRIPDRRRLKIGGNGANRHSCAPRGVGKTTQAVVAGVTGEDPGAARLERNGLPAGGGAGIVHQIASRDCGVPNHKRMRGVLDDEGACGEAGKVSRSTEHGARSTSEQKTGVVWGIRRADAVFVQRRAQTI